MEPLTQRLSSNEGDSPFDRGLAGRDFIIADFLEKLNGAALPLAAEAKAHIAAHFDGVGGYGPGGRPLL